jgi:hypothetical protein
MCMAEFFRTKLEAMGPGEKLVVDREWIQWLLDTQACGCSAPGVDGGLPAAGSALGYTVKELAGILEWSVSKTKTRLAAGVFGDPDLLKPEPPAWNVPPDNLRALLAKLAQGYQITQEGLRPPADDRRAGPEGAWAATATPAEMPPESKDVSLPPARRAKSAGRRHNGWRKYTIGVDDGSPA